MFGGKDRDVSGQEGGVRWGGVGLWGAWWLHERLPTPGTSTQ